MSVKVQDYTVLLDQKIGQGNNSVYKAQCKNKQNICVKVIEKANLSPEQKEQINREKQITELLKKVDHQNIIKYYDLIDDGEKIYIFMESCQKTLADHINAKSNQFSTIEYLDFLQQISLGYKKLIELNIIHRDFKVDNVVLNKCPSGQIIYKIIDFGSGLIFKQNTQRATTYAVGTYLFSAPEVKNAAGINGYDWNCDIYSLGIIILAMAGVKDIRKKEWIDSLPEKYEQHYISQLIKIDTIPIQILDILDSMITKMEWRINWQYLNGKVQQLLRFSQNMAKSGFSQTNQSSSRLSENQPKSTQNKQIQTLEIPNLQQFNQSVGINQQLSQSFKPSLQINSNRSDLARQSFPNFQQTPQNNAKLQNQQNIKQPLQWNQQINQPQQTPVSHRQDQNLMIQPTTFKQNRYPEEQLINSVPIYHSNQQKENQQHFGQIQQQQCNQLILQLVHQVNAQQTVAKEVRKTPNFAGQTQLKYAIPLSQNQNQLNNVIHSMQVQHFAQPQFQFRQVNYISK